MSSAPITSKTRPPVKNWLKDAGQPSAEVQLPDYPPAGLGFCANSSIAARKLIGKKLLRYLVSFRHHNGIPRAVRRTYLQRYSAFLPPESLSVYARPVSRRSGHQPVALNTDFVPATGRLVRQ